MESLLTQKPLYKPCQSHPYVQSQFSEDFHYPQQYLQLLKKFSRQPKDHFFKYFAQQSKKIFSNLFLYHLDLVLIQEYLIHLSMSD